MEGLINLLGGPVLGLVGSIWTQKLKLKEQELQMAADNQKFRHEVELRKQEAVARHEAHEDLMEANVAETEADLAKTVVKGSYDGLIASLEHDKSLDGGKFWNSVRTSVRPTLTYGLVVTSICYSWLAADMNDRTASLAVILNLTGLAATWWFGDRMSKTANNKFIA